MSGSRAMCSSSGPGRQRRTDGGRWTGSGARPASGRSPQRRRGSERSDFSKEGARPDTGSAGLPGAAQIVARDQSRLLAQVVPPDAYLQHDGADSVTIGARRVEAHTSYPNAELSRPPFTNGLPTVLVLHQLFGLATPNGWGTGIELGHSPARLSVDGREVNAEQVLAVLEEWIGPRTETDARAFLVYAEQLLRECSTEREVPALTNDQRARMNVQELGQLLRGELAGNGYSVDAFFLADALVSRLPDPAIGDEELNSIGELFRDPDIALLLQRPLALLVQELSYGSRARVQDCQGRVAHLDALVPFLTGALSDELRALDPARDPDQVVILSFLCNALASIGSHEALNALGEMLPWMRIDADHPELFRGLILSAVREMPLDDLLTELGRLVEEAVAILYVRIGSDNLDIQDHLSRDNVSALLQALEYLVRVRFEGQPPDIFRETIQFLLFGDTSIAVLRDMGEPTEVSEERSLSPGGESIRPLVLDGFGATEHLLVTRLLGYVGERPQLESFVLQWAYPAILADRADLASKAQFLALIRDTFGTGILSDRELGDMSQSLEQLIVEHESQSSLWQEDHLDQMEAIPLARTELAAWRDGREHGIDW